ncbi:MAG: TrkH family potassium uptake protein [bacterium]
MHKTAVALAIGKLMQVLGLILLVPLAISWYDLRGLDWHQMLETPETFGLVWAIGFSVVVGSLITWLFREGREYQGIREGYAIVTFGWLTLTFICAIPFTLYFISTGGTGWGGLLPAFTDAYFEVMSGFTTTGASILTDIEILPRSLLFLRALTHWLGGMGIITLAIVIFPAMGVSGYQMFRGEVPGPSKDKLLPRLRQTASILWGVYCLFTAVQTVALWAGGMSVFDAVCHSFATMATGGFSNSNGSIAGYNSPFIEWVVIIFMYLAGVNFVLHWRALRGDTVSVRKNKEFVFYNGVILAAVVIITAVLQFHGLAPLEIAADQFRHNPLPPEQFAEHYYQQAGLISNFGDAFRIAVFQALSIVTTTGFATVDFDLWPDFLRIIMVMLMFFGGCAGSTGGGMKMIRVMITLKVALTELRKLMQPRLVAPVKVGDQIIEDKMVINIVSFSILFVLLFVVVAIAMTLFVPDFTTAVTCSIATIGNIGPGLAGIGSVENYAWIPIPGKWILVFSMLLGRLEIFTVLIIFRAAAWRR